MNKEEILAKSKEENKNGDEREKIIKLKSRNLAMVIIYILTIIVLVLNKYFNREVTVIRILNDVITVYFIVSLSLCVYRYIVEREKIYLVNVGFDFLITLYNIIELLRELH